GPDRRAEDEEHRDGAAPHHARCRREGRRVPGRRLARARRPLRRPRLGAHRGADPRGGRRPRLPPEPPGEDPEDRRRGDHRPGRRRGRHLPLLGADDQGGPGPRLGEGHTLMTVDTGGDAALEAAAIETMLSHQVRGILYTAMYHRELEVPSAALETRAVTLNARDLTGSTPSVVPDEEKGGYDATRLLLEAG